MNTKRVEEFYRDNLAKKFAELGFTSGYEIGVNRGTYSEILCIANDKLCLKSVDPYNVVYRDPYTAGLGAERQERLFRYARRRLRPYNCEIIRKTSLETARDVPYESIDFVYIDGSHEFDYVMTDIIEWSKRVKKGGIVSGHDYNPKIWGDVVKAVNLYAETHNIETLYLTAEKTPSWWFEKPGKNMETISQILSKYDTDKNTCKKRGHCYGKVYDRLFDSFNKEGALDIIEIGVEKGWSLIAWRDFFPNANITGVDIMDRAEEKRDDIKYITSDVKELKIDQEFDIVIDDGSHKLGDVVYTVENFKLKMGGIMIIEDCQAPKHWLEKITKHTNYSIETVDLREINKQHDDFLIILRNHDFNKQFL